jgi:hypothetical protein
MSRPSPYFVCFTEYDPESKSERQVRLPLWAVSQRHANLAAKIIYPALVNKNGFDVRPVGKPPEKT